GGHGAELDVLAYKPKERRLVHLELSGAAESAHKQKGKFLKKFELTVDEYANVLGVEIEKFERVAVAGWGRTTREKCEWGNEISVMTIPKFYAEIVSRLRTVDPTREMMSEGF